MTTIPQNTMNKIRSILFLHKDCQASLSKIKQPHNDNTKNTTNRIILIKLWHEGYKNKETVTEKIAQKQTTVPPKAIMYWCDERLSMHSTHQEGIHYPNIVLMGQHLDTLGKQCVDVFLEAYQLVWGAPADLTLQCWHLGLKIWLHKHQ